MKKAKKYTYAAVLVGAIMILSIYAPEVMSKYYDKLILEKVSTEKIDSFHIAYRYQLSNWERVFIFSNARDNLSSSQRYTTSSLKMENVRIEKLKSEYIPVNSAYALLANKRGSGINELSREEAIRRCLEEMEKLKNMGILPEFSSHDLEKIVFEAELYSVVNIAEAAKNISVWELYSIPENVMGLQFDLDAQTGKIYSFIVRTDVSFRWDNLDVWEIVKNYCHYLGIDENEAEEYTKDDMTERTPYFKKYILKEASEKEGEIFLTIGFNPGNNSFFIRIP